MTFQAQTLKYEAIFDFEFEFGKHILNVTLARGGGGIERFQPKNSVSVTFHGMCAFIRPLRQNQASCRVS